MERQRGVTLRAANFEDFPLVDVGAGAELQEDFHGSPDVATGESGDDSPNELIVLEERLQDAGKVERLVGLWILDPHSVSQRVGMRRRLRGLLHLIEG